MKKILVTGASGFLGSNFLKTLHNANYKIYAVSRTKKTSNDQIYNWIEADLSDQKQTDKIIQTVSPEILMHFAWGIGPKLKKSVENQDQWIDISMYLAKVFAANGGKRIVIAGTCAEYQWGSHSLLDESTLLNPRSIYGTSKKDLFLRLSSFCKQVDLSYAWGRIFYLYGPNENKNRIVPHVINSIAKNKEVLTTEGNQVYDYLHVEDVVRAFMKLIESDYCGPVNICSGKPLKLKDLILKIANQMNGSHLVRFGAIDAGNHAQDYVVGNNNQLKKISNWKQKIDIDEGIRKMIKYLTTKEQLNH